MKSAKAKYYRFKTEAEIVAAASQIMEKAVDVTDSRPFCGSVPSSARYLCARHYGLESEVFEIMLLDGQHKLIKTVELFQGTINGASVYPREVVKCVLAHNAAAVILTHNHPSGIPEPSDADRQITRRLQDALGLIDVKVLDHVITGGGSYCSFAQRGIIN